MKRTMKSKAIASVAMLLVSAVALTSASYAWFTMQKEVSVTGLSLTATAPTNLQISTDLPSEGKDAPETGFGATATFNTTTKKFVPVSGPTYTDTTPGLFYAATTDTSKIPVGGALTDLGTSTFTAVVGQDDVTNQYYVDIPVWIKTASLDASKKIDVTVKDVAIAAQTNGEELLGAYRVAAVGTTPIYGAVKDGESWTPLASATALAGATISSTAYPDTTVITTLTDTTPQKVMLRFWLEGQDADCKNINAGQNVNFAITFDGTEATK